MKIGRVFGEEVVAWAIDFIHTDIEALDRIERWKLSVDAQKFLRLYDSKTEEGEIYNPPPIKLTKLQKELGEVFRSHLLPLLEGKGGKMVKLPGSDLLAPRILFVDADGDLVSTRLIEGDIEQVGVANFIDAIHAITILPVNSFRKCEGCSRWFFPIGNRTRKNRRFCNRSCNLRATAKRQRERMKKIQLAKSQSKENN